MSIFRIKFNRVAICILTCLSLLTGGCEDVDLMLVAEAGKDAVKAGALSDEAVRNLAVKAAQFSDSQHQIAAIENRYSQRLKKLTDMHVTQDAYIFNFKVYVSSDINAFAMALTVQSVFTVA